MLIVELNSFFEVHNQLTRLENWQNQNLVSRDQIAQELSTVQISNQLEYGFFKKINKETKVRMLKISLEEARNRIELGNELLKMVCWHISEVEIPFLKTQRKQRLLEIWKEFSRKQIEKVNEEITFWKCLARVEDTNL